MSGKTPAPAPGRDKFDAWFDSASAEETISDYRGALCAMQDERDSLTERIAELVTEGNKLRALVDEILTARRVADALGIERVAALREKAGLQAGSDCACGHMLWQHRLPVSDGYGPCADGGCDCGRFNTPAVTAGTEHLAEQIRRLAIPDEEI